MLHSQRVNECVAEVSNFENIQTSSRHLTDKNAEMLNFISSEMACIMFNIVNEAIVIVRYQMFIDETYFYRALANKVYGYYNNVHYFFYFAFTCELLYMMVILTFDRFISALYPK